MLSFGTQAADMLLGVTSLSVSPAPVPGPSLGLATPQHQLGQGSDWLYLLVHTRPEKGRMWGSISPEAAF